MEKVIATCCLSTFGRWYHKYILSVNDGKRETRRGPDGRRLSSRLETDVILRKAVITAATRFI